jgi:predicted  nucleic acid-binding Zn-ribbon protein
MRDPGRDLSVKMQTLSGCSEAATMMVGDTLAVDGQAMATTAASVKDMASTSDSALMNQIAELKRKLERKETEMRRKDKELSIMNRESNKLEKDVKRMTIDVEDYRKRNEGLQQALSNSRLLTQEARDEATKKQDMSKARELEDDLLKAKHMQLRTEENLDGAKAQIIELEKQVGVIRAARDDVVDVVTRLKEELENAQLRIKAMQVLSNEKDSELDRQRAEVGRLKNLEVTMVKDLETKRDEVTKCRHQISELVDEVKGLRKSLDVRNETNSVLKNQLDGANKKSYVLTEEEFEHFKKLDGEASKLKGRNRDLVKSVEMHMSLLEKAENENAGFKEELGELKTNYGNLRREYDVNQKTARSSDTTIKTLKKEVTRLRSDNTDLEEELKASQLDPLARDVEVQNIRSGMVNLVRGRQEELEAKKEERKQRKTAEDASKAMRSRISFLLEQLDQASKLVIGWQEQKSIFAAEISALHQSNLTLRSRLMSLQQSFISRQIGDAAAQETARVLGTLHEVSSPMKRDLGMHHTKSALAAVLTEAGADPDATMENLGEPFDHPASNTMPLNATALVERAVFDQVCAYETGERSSGKGGGKSASAKKSNKNNTSLLKAFIADDGLLAIGLESGTNTRKLDSEVVEAEELLNGLQIHAFLKFSQSRPDGKVSALFTEKLASVLNFIRKLTNETSSQLGESRVKLADATSRLAVTTQRSNRMKDRVVNERISKQKTVMKYLREQMRQSDFRIAIHDITSTAKNELNDLEESTGGVAGRETGMSREILRQLVGVSSELTTIGLSSGTASGPPGAMELRMPDTLLDDETVHGMVELLKGNVAKDEGMDTLDMSRALPEKGPEIAPTMTLKKTLLTASGNYLNRVLLLNLRGNQITDLTCKLLAGLVENSQSLRMVDLRSNLISPKGARIMFDATRRNTTVLYVTQRQGGFMIEGHRDIVGQKGTKAADNGKGDDGEEKEIFDRMVGTPKHPIRIDIRHNASGPEALEGLVESYSSNVKSTRVETNEMVADRTVKRDGRNEGFNKMPESGAWTNRGIHEEVKEDFRLGKLQGSDKPASHGSMTVRKSTSNMTIRRPSSAGTHRKSTSELRVGVGSKAGARGSPNGKSNIMERSKENHDSLNPVGSLLDTHIRSLQESPAATAVLEGSSRNKGGPGSFMGNQIQMMDTYKGAMESLKPAFAKNQPVDAMTLQDVKKMRPASAGASSRMTMKERLAKNKRQSQTAKLPKSMGGSSRLRPVSAGATSRPGKKTKSATALLNDLQSLNPGVLF